MPHVERQESSIPPSKGRIVRYREKEEAGSVAAVIVADHGASCISLNCFTMSGVVVETSINYGDPLEGPFPCWYWPREE